MVNVHKFFENIWDWCFPELKLWEISEYSGEILMYFQTDTRNFTVSLKDWDTMLEIDKHYMLIRLCHRILK